jgi:hypothetical protein
MRPEIVVAQLHEQITRLHRMIIGNRYRGHQPGYFRAKGRKVCPHVRIVRALPRAVTDPLIPIARNQN